MSTPPVPESTNAATAALVVDPLAVASRFVKTYYSTLVELGDVSKFYQKSSQLSFGIADDFAEPITSPNALRETFPETITSVDISAVDAQRINGTGGSILIVITGRLVLSLSSASSSSSSLAPPSSTQGFVQTFVLSPQGAKAFVVANDILRLLERNEETPTGPTVAAAVEVAAPSSATAAAVVVARDEEKPPMQTPEPAETLAAVVSPPSKMNTTTAKSLNNNNAQQQPNGGSKPSKPTKGAKPQYQPRAAPQAPSASPGHGTEESKEPVLLDHDEDTVPPPTANGTVPAAKPATSTTTTPTPTTKQPWGPRNYNNNNSNSNANPHHPTTMTTMNSNTTKPAYNSTIGSTKPHHTTTTTSNIPQRDPECTIIVKQLDETITREEIRQCFMEFGEITDVSVLANRGLAYVDFTNKEPVRRILARDDFRIKDRNVAVCAKLPKPPHHHHVRGGGGRRPGGRFYRGGGDRGGGGHRGGGGGERGGGGRT